MLACFHAGPSLVPALHGNTPELGLGHPGYVPGGVPTPQCCQMGTQETPMGGGHAWTCSLQALSPAAGWQLLRQRCCNAFTLLLMTWVYFFLFCLPKKKKKKGTFSLFFAQSFPFTASKITFQQRV